ncbi:MAG TPA: hypothetical protein VGY56_04605 [Verrucomicrobiae bacterium]|nr:hypothetical protein [Verrucomicrobiae bacterium]
MGTRKASKTMTVVIRPYAGDAGKMPQLDPAKLPDGRFHGKNFKCDTAFTQKLAESIAAASNALDLQTG